MSPDVPGARPPGSLATAVRLAPLFLRRRDTGVGVRLPVAAYGVVTALLALVAGGAQSFFRGDDDLAATYATLAVIALVLLVVPLLTVGASAARLAARRRDDRLSSLRLLGATRGTVTALTVLEAAAGAFVGAVAGLVLYAATAPLLGLLRFRGAPLGGDVWLPWTWLPLVVLVVVVLAAVSAAAGLRAVVVTPLGVRTRQRPATAGWVRAVVAAAVLLAGVGSSQLLGLAGEVGGIVLVVGVLAAAFGGMLLALNLAGPWWVAARARRSLRRADDVPRLLAARRVLDDPRTAWRQVSGLAMTSFVGVFGGVGLALSNATEASNPQERWLMADVSTGLLVTMTVSFVMVACSVAVNQAAATLDRAAVHVAMDRLGVPPSVMAEAARRSVMSTVWSVAGGSALTAAVLVSPLVGFLVFTQPVAIGTFVVVFAAGVGTVRLAASVAARLVPDILAHPSRAL
ncbi:FtsX-like permease family protein [Isoptericola jiangsuensis]|uniref:FtsX-like permease family protein n=1 Tax=Isoptericola jiangsuensis TaxID=548579 RepID=A0A2A9EUJ7_9MICO|nr:FtsX-like permease family protein [Isoptericola jiangsuensis]PFG41952.1 FtsX-like permease family protein [Isoptericola jiangsuensis]